MNTPHSAQIRRLPLAIVSCVALALAACEPKSAATDPAKERQLQDMQAKLDALSAQSSELNKQLADRDAQDAQAKRDQLEQAQADLDKQRAQLEADRQALANATPVARELSDSEATSGNVRTSSTEDAEPVYQGKPATYDVFYSKLQDDGDWIDSDEYGYIWRPNVATRERSWRPYADGRWVETDRGWTWDSNERFGWATYHYGRWVNLNSSGWCWVPGNEWAPAWVSWRSSDRYVGWAPLPPEARIVEGGRIDASEDVGYDTGPGFYNFVDTEDFGEDSYVGHIVNEEQNVTIINQTVNVTNITYNDRVINNYGPDYDQIGRRSRRPVGRYQLDLDRSAQFDRDATVPRPRGDRLAVVAPFLVASQSGNSNVRPAKVEKKIVKADRADGWKAVNPAQRQAVKAELAKTADRQAQNQQAQREAQRAATQRQAARAAREKTAAQTQPQTPPNASRPANPAKPVQPASAPAPKPAAAPAPERQANRPVPANKPAKNAAQTNPGAQNNQAVNEPDQPNQAPKNPDNRPNNQPNAAQLAAQQAQRQQARAEQEANTRKAIQANQAAAMQKQNREQAARQQQVQAARQQEAAQARRQQAAQEAQQAERQANRNQQQQEQQPRQQPPAQRERPQPGPQQAQPQRQQEERPKGKAKSAPAADQTPEDGKQRP